MNSDIYLCEPCANKADPHLLKNACMYLMSNYSVEPSLATADGICHHLELLLLHPEIRFLKEHREFCMSLLEKWRKISRKHSDKKMAPVEPKQTSIH